MNIYLNEEKFENKNHKVELKIDELIDTNEIRYGAKCNKCNEGSFDYDGMLNLVCNHCGFTSGGCFT